MTATVTAPLVALGKKAAQVAGDLEQSIGGAEAVYGDFYDKIMKKAQQSASVMGTSTNEYLEYANKIGSLMKGSGLQTAQAYDLTTKAMERASDVASIMGIDVSSAMEAITGAAKGNFTMMDNLGVAMNATSLQSYALSKGIKKSYTAMSQAEKVQLAYNMFLEQTSEYAGNYRKENKTLNGSLTTLRAEFSNLSAEIGQQLIPIAMKIIEKVKAIVNWWNNLDAGTKKIIVRVAEVIAIVGPALLIIGKVITIMTSIGGAITTIIGVGSKLISVIKVLIVVFKTLFAVMLANPISLIIVGIVAFIAAIVLLYKKCEWFRNLVNKIFTFIKNLIINRINLIIAIFKIWLKVIKTVVDFIKSIPGKVASIPGKIKDKFKKLPEQFKEIGKNMLKGLWQGANDMKDWVIDKIKGLGKGILKGMKKALGIKSPSKEFAIIGRYSMLGYEEGLEKMKPQIDKAINGMFNLSPSLTGTMNNTLSPNVNVVNNVNVETDPLGQVVSKIKTFSGGAKNDYNYGYGG